MSERLPEEFTKAQVEERVRDWQRRLEEFFASTKSWAKDNGWVASDAGSIMMNEELMQKLAVQTVNMPTLRLDKSSKYALFKPKGLWVIGANGRIDLYTSKGSYIIVDRASAFADPKWTIFRSDNPNGTPFDPTLISGLV